MEDLLGTERLHDPGLGACELPFALAALASAAVLAVLSIDIVVSQFPRGLIVLAGLVLAFAAAWYGLTRTEGARILGSGIAILAVAGTR